MYSLRDSANDDACVRSDDVNGQLSDDDADDDATHQPKQQIRVGGRVSRKRSFRSGGRLSFRPVDGDEGVDTRGEEDDSTMDPTRIRLFGHLTINRKADERSN